MTEPATLRDASCADDYDPNSMPVDKARALIARARPTLLLSEDGAARIDGGVSDTELNELAVRPTSVPSSARAVTMVTPVANMPSAARNAWASSGEVAQAGDAGYQRLIRELEAKFLPVVMTCGALA